MKKLLIYLFGGLLLAITNSCSSEYDDVNRKEEMASLPMFYNRVVIDSAYTYIGDSTYNSWLSIYNSAINNRDMVKSLSPEDDAFFNREYIVKSTEATLLYGRNYIYPGAILEANSISDQKYTPVFVSNRNPITVSMTLTHKKPKPTSMEISSPSYSKLSDYVKEMAIGGSFEQNEKFMYQNRRFTFYDEIKSVFGTNVNTRKLFSSKKESSSEEREKILKSTGMYVKFYQASFTVNMDAAPLSNQPIKGKTNLEPVYVNSVTYGRLGILVFESDETYEFAETCIKKEFDRIFYNKTTTITEKERLFFENTEFKVLIIGADSDYTVQTIKGYGHFLNLIYNSKFTETSFGVPISCTFAYANTHGLVETEFVNHLQIEPLFVKLYRIHQPYTYWYNGPDYNSSSDIYLYFFKDRAKTKAANPYTDIIFEVTEISHKDHYYNVFGEGSKVFYKPSTKTEYLKLRNKNLKSNLYLGKETASCSTVGKQPTGNGPLTSYWEKNICYHIYRLENSPFYIIVY